MDHSEVLFAIPTVFLRGKQPPTISAVTYTMYIKSNQTCHLEHSRLDRIFSSMLKADMVSSTLGRANPLRNLQRNSARLGCSASDGNVSAHSVPLVKDEIISTQKWVSQAPYGKQLLPSPYSLLAGQSGKGWPLAALGLVYECQQISTL